MNKKYHSILLAAEFSAAAVFLIIPPMLTSQSLQKHTAAAPRSLEYILTIIFISALLFFSSKYIHIQKPRRKQSLLSFFSAAVSLGLLFCNARLWSYFASVFKQTAEFFTITENTVLLWAGIAVTSCYEEICYRLYLPAFFKYISASKHTLVYFMLSEILPVLLFAAAHRYAGIFSVINAFTAALLFRILLLSTGSVMYPCAVHIIYNITTLLCAAAVMP